ncbi:hypothetical protein FRB96_009073 [Tulasnella sp. 330]|nr:hypothetical protein FRB96_009073 [Tulasnella sp. 330]KAG8881354.1 hypothetical protein FRB98_004398 [Tulasnella sp. 332]
MDSATKTKRPNSLQHFKGVVATPSDVKTYNIERWAANVVKKAAYVVYPVDTEDISTAILFALAEVLPIAIAGGRHDVGGASSTEGVVIDMRNMNAVRVDKEKNIGYLEGGTTIYQANQELFKHGLTTTLGMGSSVGLVGLCIGGGLGLKMGQHGLACDNVVSATMVLANGEIVFVDETENPELLWGIKGGPVASKTVQIPYNTYSALADDYTAIPGNKIGVGAHFNQFDYETVKKSCDMLLAVTPKAPASVVLWEFYYYDLVTNVPPEATAFPQRTKDKTALVALYGFKDAWMTEAKTALAEIKKVLSSSSAGSARDSIGYLNYAAILAAENETDMNARRAFGSNYSRLQELKRKYDPDMVFNKWFCIVPAKE